MCQHLISFAGGVQSLNATVKGAQLLAAKCIYTGKTTFYLPLHTPSHLTCLTLSHLTHLTLSPTVGVVNTYEILSLEMVRNALASLTQAGLIRQPSRCIAIRRHGNIHYVFHVCVFICSEVEGRDRLVKVDKQEKLVQLAEELGEHNTDMVYSNITKAIV